MSRFRGSTVVLAVAASLVVGACMAAAPAASPEPSPTTAAPAAPTPAPATASPTTAPTSTPTAAAAATPRATPDDDPDDYYGPGNGGTATSAPTSAPAGSPSGRAMEVLTSPEDGEYLAVDGRALYTFTPDGPNRSTCFDDCAVTWPPLIGAVVAGDGVTGTIGGFNRPGEGRQISYNGDPLYFFAADTEPGDTRGHGRGGNWFLARP